MDQKLILSLTASVSALTGAMIGFGVATKRLNKIFEERLTAENESTREFYQKLYKVGKFESPIDAAADLLPDEAVEALKKYAGEEPEVPVVQTVNYHNITIKPEDLEDTGSVLQDATVHNVFQEQGDDVRLDPELRDTSKPYIVSEDEWSEGQDEYDHITLTYYAGDLVLCDDDDEVINQVDEIVGMKNLDFFGVGVEDPNIVFVRNERLKSDFEITRREDEFKVQVLGFKPTNLQHSDEPMTRRRRLQD